MQIKHQFRVVMAALALAACGNGKEIVAVEDESVNISDQSMMATLWMQQSMESIFLREQSYKLAAEKFERNLQKHKADGMYAVIVDIDETVLDNSPYMARLIKTGQAYDNEGWSRWVNEGRAGLVPGVKGFLNKVEASGTEVFYISNRHADLMEATLENLNRHELPFADDAHVLLMTSESDKTERREEVKLNYKVLLLVGDQLTDFAQQKEDYSMAIFDVEGAKDSLDNYFVLLPNPMYGSFEDRIYKGEKDLQDRDKDEARRHSLITKE